LFYIDCIILYITLTYAHEMSPIM